VAWSGSGDARQAIADPSPLAVELPLFALLYVGWRIGKRSRSPALLEIDLDSGRHQDGADEQRDEEKLVQREAGKLRWFWKVYGTIA
jgi:amino acid permease